MGVDDVFEIGPGQAAETMMGLLSDKRFGVVIVEEALLDALPRLDRYQLSNSIKPVFVAIGPESGSDLQRKVKRAVGIDLYKGGDN